ncbi:hypothetical protein EDB92DRAFT_1525695 [Lactarius akahatsu]|uniref:Cytochrome P450 n=1 Tax=Lactarius akahatsu TaxID=416441 RepID=A0AAD4LLZ0_9AGAM|nr:hypothetical protein EDB92DRAFT_1525695 [Lactarius akahatsu]
MDIEYHVDVIRSKLTRNIHFKSVRDELIRSLDASIPVRGDDWVKAPVLETMLRVVCATANRVFVGSPLCRNQDFLTLKLNFTANVMKFATIINMFPKPLKSYIAMSSGSRRSLLLSWSQAMVEERFARMDEFREDRDGKPNDMLMWLMSESKGVERSPEGLARRLLAVNFAAIHTTSLNTLNPSATMSRLQ